jgi:chemotaxis response regulator CheB
VLSNPCKKALLKVIDVVNFIANNGFCLSRPYIVEFHAAATVLQCDHETLEGAMIGHDMIVIGASAGGVEALKELVHLLPADLPSAIGIVLHLPTHATSVLPAILSRDGPLPAVHPEDGQTIKRGHIYVAPPDYHMLIKHSRISLAHRLVWTTPPGIPAVFACPECGGTLWEVLEGDLLRFRCRIGHAFTVHSLL